MLCTGERWVRTSRRRLERWPHNAAFRFGALESIPTGQDLVHLCSKRGCLKKHLCSLPARPQCLGFTKSAARIQVGRYSKMRFA
jgi:hypothetical protein